MDPGNRVAMSIGHARVLDLGEDGRLPLPWGAVRRLGGERFLWAAPDLSRPPMVRFCRRVPGGRWFLAASGGDIRLLEAASGLPRALLRLEAEVRDLVATPGAGWVAVVDTTDAVWLWDTGAAAVRRLPAEPQDECVLVALSPDGDRVAVARWGGLTRVHRTSDGSTLYEVPSPLDPGERLAGVVAAPTPHSLGFTTDGSELFVHFVREVAFAGTRPSHDLLLQVDAATGALRRQGRPDARMRSGGRSAIDGWRYREVVCGDDGRLLLVDGIPGRSCAVHDPFTGERLSEDGVPPDPRVDLEALRAPVEGEAARWHRLGIRALAASPCGRWCSTGEVVVDLESGETRPLVPELEPGARVLVAGFRGPGGPAARVVRSASGTTRLEEHDPVTGAQVGSGPKVAAAIREAWLDSAGTLLRGRTPGPGLRFHPADGGPARRLADEWRARGALFLVAPDAVLHAVAGRPLEWWPRTGGEPRRGPPVPEGMRPLGLGPDEGTLALLDEEGGGLMLLDVACGRLEGPLALDARPAGPVAFSEDGTLLALADEAWGVELWNLRQRRRVTTLDQQLGQVTALAFGPETLLTGDAAGTVLVFDRARLG